MKTTEGTKLRTINHLLTQSVAERNLNLLRQIDETVDALQIEKCAFDHFTDMLHEAIRKFSGAQHVIDESGKLLAMFEKTRDSVEMLHTHTGAQCDCARNDKALRDDDGVVDGYCELLESLAHLHHALNAMCWAIGENDADFDKPSGKAYENLDEMFAAMGV